MASADQLSAIDELMPKDEDLLYEEELLRNPYSLKMWWRYIQARTDATAKRRYLLFERALKALPGSYKLWHAYLDERRAAVRGLRLDHAALEALNNTYERALVTMHKMPRVWLDYLEILMSQKLITQTRRTFDKALSALPITQHDRIWVLYLRFIGQTGVPVETALRVYRRYLKLEPNHIEEYMAYLRIKERWAEVARSLANVLNDDTFRSLEGKSKHQLWLELCDIITKHPKDVADISVEAVIRGGIRKFTDEVGRLWTSLADYCIRRGLFEKARDVYEEGLNTVITVHDFSLIFDAYTQFEESLLAARMQSLDDEEAEVTDEGDGEDFLLKDDGNDIDLRLARLEHLMARRPELLSSVMLRQNPHNVHEWHKRVRLFQGNPTKQIQTYTQAVKTVDVGKAIGKPHTLWVAFAKFYEKHGDLANARVVFDKATQVHYRYADDLASVFCEWAEMEMRHKNYAKATEVVRRATQEPHRPRKLTHEEERQLPPQERIYRNLKLWTLRADLEESLGTFESTCAVYDRIMELRIASPQIILNYCLYLQESNHFEDSFKVYERAVSIFKYPHLEPIWNAYLTQFVQRYKGAKLERARDLFESAISTAPPDKAKLLYLMYAKLEEDYGMARHAMAIYERAAKAVPKAERMSIYDVYLAKAQEFYGIGKVREVYEMAFNLEPPEDLPDEDAKTMALRYASLERSIGEIDRARAIFAAAASLADPRRDKTFWEEWKRFEANHGNEDTFREMLRIQRSVAASYSHVHMQSAADVARVADMSAQPAEPADTMEALEAQAEAQQQTIGGPSGGGTRLMGFVSAGVYQQGAGELPQKVQQDQQAAKQMPADEAEIDIEADEDAEEGRQHSEDADELEQQPIPATVFGSLAASAQPEETDEQLGARERFKKRRTQ